MILLVGGTGFLGSYVAQRLVGREFAMLVRAGSDRSHVPAGVEARVGDLDDVASLERTLAGVDSVIYCASMGFGQVPPLLALLERAGVKRAVFVSTTAIFTRLPAGSRKPRLAAEEAVRRSGLDWTILRPTMIYGSGRDRNIARLLRFLRRSPVFPLVGAEALHQPIYVEDLADAVVAAFDAPAAIGKAYNLGASEPLTYGDLVRTAARAVGRGGVLLPTVPIGLTLFAARVAARLPLPRVVSPEQVQRLAEDKSFVYADAVADFQFKPRSFAEGVALEAAEMGLA